MKSPFDAHGEWSHISKNQDLWLVVRSGVEGRWYPVERLQRFPDKSWDTQKQQNKKPIKPAAGWQELELFLIPSIESGTLLDYVKLLPDHDPGLSSLPPEAELMWTVDLNVET